MNFHGNDFIFLVIVGLATYAYVAFVFSKEPDPLTEFGMSLNAMLAALLALGTTVVALIIVLLANTIGYAVVILVYFFLIPKIVRRIISGNGKATV